MRITIKRKTLFATLSLMVGTLIVVLLREYRSYLLNWIGIFIFMYAVFTWKWEKKTRLFSLYSIFFGFMLLFSYGQCVMWALGIGMDKGIGSAALFSSRIGIPSESDLVNTKVYTCLSMFCMHVGALISPMSRQNNAKIIEGDDAEIKSREELERRLLFIVGIIVTTIVAPLAVFQKAKEMIIARSFGYAALYYGDYSTQSGYIQIILFLFFPGMLCLLIGSNYSKKIVRVVVAIFGVYALFGIMSGDRGSWLYSMVILAWMWVRKDNRIGKRMIGLIALGVIGIYLLSVITKVRDTGLSKLSFDIFLKAFSVDNSPIVDAFFEMGGSMGIITYLLMNGTEFYPFANSFLLSILGAFSSRFLSVIGMTQVSVSNWFSQTHLGLSYGTGFSMIGEAYLNGGYIGGLVYMFIIGLVIGRLISNDKIVEAQYQSPIKTFVAIATAKVIMGWPRAAAYLVVKEFVYGVLFVLLLVYLLRGILKKRTNVRR